MIEVCTNDYEVMSTSTAGSSPVQRSCTLNMVVIIAHTVITVMQ
jgi:hypothetical protein